jgi:hypothetical protein
LSDEAFQALLRQLGGSAPDGLKQLDAEQLRDLAEAVREARHRQAAALADAGDRALGHIPRLLRVPIRRIVG